MPEMIRERATSAGNRVDASTSVAYPKRTLDPADADSPMPRSARSLPYRLPPSVAVAVASSSRPGLTTPANAYNPRRYSRSPTGMQVSVFQSFCLLSDGCRAGNHERAAGFLEICVLASRVTIDDREINVTPSCEDSSSKADFRIAL